MNALTETPNSQIAKDPLGERCKPAKYIGKIEGDTLFLVSDPEKRWFRVDEDSCTFNLEMMRQSKFKALCVVTPTGGILFTTKWFLLRKGGIHGSGDKPVEREVFLSRAKFGWEEAFEYACETWRYIVHMKNDYTEPAFSDEYIDWMNGGCDNLDEVLSALSGCPVGGGGMSPSYGSLEVEEQPLT
jgi:hypothetical protein